MNFFSCVELEMSQASKVLKEAGQLLVKTSLGGNAGVEVLDGAKSLVRGDSGKVFVFGSATGFTLTLPAVADAGNGWNAKFVVGTAPTSGNHVVTEATASDTNILHGGICEADVSAAASAAATAGTGATQVNFLASNANIGDFVEITAVNSLWVITSSMSQADASVTIT